MAFAIVRSFVEQVDFAFNIFNPLNVAAGVYHINLDMSLFRQLTRAGHVQHPAPTKLTIYPGKVQPSLSRATILIHDRRALLILSFYPDDGF